MLKKEGVITKERGYTVFDVDAIKDQDFWKKHRDVYLFMKKGSRKRFRPCDIFQILGDIKVIPKDQYEEYSKEGGEIVDVAMSVEDYLREQFGEEYVAQTNKVAENLLRRGKALLTLFADDESIASEQVFEKLEKIKAEVEILKESFKDIKMSGKSMLFENIKAIQLQIVSSSELASKKESIKKMKAIYLENYKDFPEEFQDKLIESLESKLNNPKAKFYTLYHKKEIVAFCSATPQEDGTVHFANFNIDPNYQFSKLGEAMMEASLDEEAKKSTIVAEAVPDAKITDTYLNKKGFEKIGEIEVGGVKLWKIRREKG